MACKRCEQYEAEGNIVGLQEEYRRHMRAAVGWLAVAGIGVICVLIGILL